MDNHQRVELLSPAGNMESFYGAIRAGADAVYLAGNRFGARAYAENFTTEELVECIRYGHLLGRKIYLTVNTLLKNSELAGLYDYLLPFCQAGLDAVIVQDIGVLRFVREHFPECRLHASTQMTLCSGHGASLLKAMGASRIIPSRELSLDELISMKQGADIEIEAFVHGAMCYCYSGQCLFSSILGGRSGNRGRCAQPCRLPYSIVTEGEESNACYPLSLKDLCTIEHIPKLVEAGIDSFKIEGRMKKPEYAAGVTALYRRYIDKYYELRREMGSKEAASSYHVSKEDLDVLRSLYIRSGIQDGYYFRRGGREMITLDSPAYSGSNEELLRKLHEEYIHAPLKLPVTVTAIFHTGKPAQVTLRWQDIQAFATGAPVEKAKNQPISADNVRTQLGKLGDSAFYAAEINISLGQGCFYPLKQMNELRRAAVAELERQILIYQGYKTDAPKTISPGDIQKMTVDSACSNGSEKMTGYAFSVLTMPQLEAVADWFYRNPLQRPMRIYIDGDLCLQEQEKAFHVCEKLSDRCDFFATLPYIIREADHGYLERLYAMARESGIFQGFLVRSLDGLGFICEKEEKICCRADAGLYLWNQSALREMNSRTNGFCLPYELNAREQRELLGALPRENLSCEKMIYSRIPMMVTANCLLGTSGKCIKRARANPAGQRHVDGEQCHVALKDRYHRVFPVGINCLHCMNIIYNSVPYSLHQTFSLWNDFADLRMDFTIESASEVGRILDSFLKGAPFPRQEYTAGHEKRGVE